MPVYICKVLDAIGKKKVVTKEAVDKVSLEAYLKKEQLILVSAKVYKEKKPNTFLAVSSKIKLNEVTTFLRQFSVMITAGTPISDCLNMLRSQKYTKAFQKVITEIYFDVQSGILLSEAFEKHPKVFPNFFVSMIGIGEVSGSLDKVLVDLANYYENDRKIKRKAKSSMVYPMFLLGLVVVVFFFITLFILPQFESTISELGGEIPTITKVIMSISRFMKQNILFIMGGLCLFIFLIFLFLKTKQGKFVKAWLTFKLPLIGAVNRYLITSRFSKAFVILLGSGMNITECLESMRKMLDNALFSEKFKYTIAEVKRGKRIATSIENTNLFPKMLTEMLNVGEKSGNIEDVLIATSSYFDEMVESSIHRATTALEPLIIVLLGGLVTIVILAVLLPMMSMMQSI